VYEGLMSYTGFIAETDLYEVAKDGDSSKGSWVVPVERSESVDRPHFVMGENELTGEPEPVLHEKGTFVFRLAGRERQQSASYYTPEVLTRFVVSQALEELLDQEGKPTAADDILDFTICEPALGSGAFAIEAVRQLADEYLKRKQKELDKQIPAEDYAVQLQKVKSQIALHQVYGVDLNSTAVELAEVSLWLDTMVAELQAPWFGLHLRRGNSLIGARRATYSRASVHDKSWLTTAPADAPLSGLADAMTNESDDPNVLGRIHHFLLPAAGWGAAAEAKEVKDLASDAQKQLKAWRSRIKGKPSRAQLDRLVNLGRRVETMWQFTLRRLEVAESEARRTIDYFGKPAQAECGETPVSREEIELKLNDPNGAYQRLRRVMNAWNALWFWPLSNGRTRDVLPPSLDNWIDALEGILGVPTPELSSKAQNRLWANQTSILDPGSWEDLNTAEDLDLAFAQVRNVVDVETDAPWLCVCDSVATDQGFFHWELDFASVFARGGFNLQVGNPPWVRPDYDESSILAEHDPWWQLAVKPSQMLIRAKRQEAILDDDCFELLVRHAGDVAAMREFIADSANNPELAGLRPDLYRGFMIRTWRSAAAMGTIGLIHPESHFSEMKATALRRSTYTRLRRHWQFKNKLKLFAENTDQMTYGVHIYGGRRAEPAFVMGAWLFHPDTAARSIKHDGSGVVPGLTDENGDWDLRPHSDRIIEVDSDLLKAWGQALDAQGTPALESRMMYPINRQGSSVVKNMISERRLSNLGLEFSGGWNETSDRQKGVFEFGSKTPIEWSDVILQGPHFSVSSPLVKQPKPVVLSNNDWVENDYEAMADDFIPRTTYERVMEAQEFRRSYTSWGNGMVPSTSRFRLAWRRMAGLNGVRSLNAAILPPGPTHVNTVQTAGFSGEGRSMDLALAAGTFGSLPLDFFVKVAGMADLWPATVDRLPIFPADHALASFLAHRVARLNCVTRAYSDFWCELYVETWADDEWSGRTVATQAPMATHSSQWDVDTPLRSAADRRLASIEIDAIVAVAMDISVEDLIAIYLSQFSVLQSYERSDLYDVHGRKVPNEVSKVYRSRGELLSTEERTATNAAGATYTYDFPFIGLDRETDMRQAHAHFTQLLKEMN
jgi:hypothetical protein